MQLWGVIIANHVNNLQHTSRLMHYKLSFQFPNKVELLANRPSITACLNHRAGAAKNRYQQSLGTYTYKKFAQINSCQASRSSICIISSRISVSIYTYFVLTAALASYLQFLERTNDSITLRRCDDCASPAIILGTNSVPFGDLRHSEAYVSHHHKLLQYTDTIAGKFGEIFNLVNWRVC